MADYFIRIENSKDLRQDILISSKEAIHILKQERELSALRAKKRILITKLRRDLKELTMLIIDFEKKLPLLTKKELQELMPESIKKHNKTKHTGERKNPKKHHSKGEKQEADNDETQQELSKLERLESTLSMIEERLNKL